MAATAGNFPNFQTFDVTKIKEVKRGGQGYGRMVTPGYEYDPGKGWHKQREKGWLKSGKESGQVKLRTQTDPMGGKTKAYVIEGYDDYIGFHANDDGEMFAYAQSAFDKGKEGKEIESAEPSGGHITKIEYNKNSKVMRVTFAKNGRRGNQCLFIGVAASIANQLLYHARANDIRGPDGRHWVGIRFWDLVRIRHQPTGARLPFTYTGSSAVDYVNKGGRHSIVVSDYYAKRILGKRYYDVKESYGDTIRGLPQEYIVNDDEFKRYRKLVDAGRVKEYKKEELLPKTEKKEENAVALGKENNGVFGLGRHWKIKDFQDFASEVDGSDSEEYQSFLNNNDFQGALTFLKKQKRAETVTIQNHLKNGAVRSETYSFQKPYAGEYDEIDYDDFQRFKESQNDKENEK